jgi:hypothetical protein
MLNTKKPRKLHQLQGTIIYAFPDKVSAKGPYYHQPYYLLTVKLHQAFSPDQTDIYAFSAQVPQ